MQPRRLARAKMILKRNKPGAFLVTSAVDIQYLLDLRSSGAEREAVLLITPEKSGLFLDSRKAGAFSGVQKDLVIEVVDFSNPLAQAVNNFFKKFNLKELTFNGNDLTVAELEKFQAEAPGIKFNAGENLIADLRLIKDKAEITAIIKAVRVADEAFREILPTIKIGQTEWEIAWRLEKIMREKGAEGMAFPPIVAVGKNSAIPHHAPSKAKVAKGQNILLDFGCRVDGYCSDITRTVFVGLASDGQRRQYEAVLSAQRAALKALKPGIESGKADAAARAVIRETGFPDFNHGLGHGVGLEIHEAPYLRPGRTDKLVAGAVFSVEPGIYLPGKMGVRIEDLVLMTPAGPRVLTGAARELIVVPA